METPIWQRLLAPLIYLLPWSQAIPFGLARDGVFNQFPALKLLIVPALPLMQLDRSVPFAGFVLFFVLFLAVVRNPNVPYFLRFNTLQALLTDIVVSVLQIAFTILLRPMASGSLLMGTLANTVVVAWRSCCSPRWNASAAVNPICRIWQAVRMQLY